MSHLQAAKTAAMMLSRVARKRRQQLQALRFIGRAEQQAATKQALKRANIKQAQPQGNRKTHGEPAHKATNEKLLLRYKSTD